MSDPPQNSLVKAMTRQLSARRDKSALRSLTVAPQNSVDFSSNDFLSLSTSPILKAAFFAELDASCTTFHLGSRGSRLLDGNSLYAESLERDVALFHNAPAGLLFNSGYDANTGLFACVPQTGDFVVYDEFIHASVHEGLKLSRATKTMPFRHNCVEALGGLLEEIKKEDREIEEGRRSVFIAVESLYSMDGDLSPLSEIVQVVEKAFPHGNGHVIVDEAHSTGVYGSKGRGVVCSLGLENKVFARLHTFGKALGCHGAIILCTSLTRTYLINYARSLIYTTSLSFPSLAAIKASYSLLTSGATEPLATHLHTLIQQLYSQLQALDRRLRLRLPALSTPSPPPPQLTGTTSATPKFPPARRDDDHRALFRIPAVQPRSPIFSLRSCEPRSLAAHCQKAGFVVRAIVAPTVPAGAERVRVCLHAGNSLQDVERLVARMGEWVELQMADGAGAVGRSEAKL